MAPIAADVTARAETETVGGAEIVLTASLPQQFLRRVDLPLAAPHRGINSAPRQKLLMRAALGDDALVEHQNLVGVDHGRQAMGDHDRRASAGDALQRRLDVALGETVERRRRFVEHQNRRRLEHRARDGDPLLLAARELESPLADRRVIALRQ